MAVRPGWLGFWLLCLGCQGLPPLGQEEERSAAQCWELGQVAMRQGRTEEAIRCYNQSLAADPTLSCNHLSLAAAFLEQNDSDSACMHLRQYVDAHPDKLLMRARYAELLLQLGRLPEARTQLEEVICQAQGPCGTDSPDLIRCHSQLLAIAEESEDAYGEHLHRGIGLFLLARKCSALPEPEEGFSTESLLFKAAAELTLAHLQRPEEARPCWYLYEVWSRLGQRQPALCRLREADAAAPFTFLSPAERCSLQLAYARYLAELRRK